MSRRSKLPSGLRAGRDVAWRLYSLRLGDLALWALLVVIVIALAVAGWWSTRDRNGK
jgi:hypothetical protein